MGGGDLEFEDKSCLLVLRCFLVEKKKKKKMLEYEFFPYFCGSALSFVLRELRRQSFFFQLFVFGVQGPLDLSRDTVCRYVVSKCLQFGYNEYRRLWAFLSLYSMRLVSFNLVSSFTPRYLTMRLLDAWRFKSTPFKVKCQVGNDNGPKFWAEKLVDEMRK